MREIHSIEFEEEELQIVKSALLKFDKRSPFYEKAQKLAANLHATPIHHSYNNRQEGLTDDVLQALATLEEASAPEIEEYLKLSKPNSVSALCSRLHRQGLLTRRTVEQTGNSRGVSAKHRYSIKES